MWWKLVKYVVGVFLIIIGTALISGDSVLSGILVIASGLLLLPAITDRLPDFKGKK